MDSNLDSQSASSAYKAGFVAVMGRPNVGKSTLVNALVGQNIAAVSPRPQTTRKRQLGILTIENAQVIFIDTPGLHNPMHKLGESMNKEAADTLVECDLILFIVDASQKPQPEDLLLADLLNTLKKKMPTILVLNKSDLVHDLEILSQNTAAYLAIAPRAQPINISAAQHDNLDILLNYILDHLKAGGPFFPEDQITDLYERELAADLIRATALTILKDEVPHGIAIRIDTYQERGEQGAYIEATVFVERESHKPIVIGQGGRMLKSIGTAARAKIEAMSGRSVYLLLNVKVRKNWRNDEQVLRGFGY